MATWEPDQTEEKAAQSLTASVSRVIGLKPFPAVASKVIAMLGGESYDFKDVEAVLGEDHALVARVIQSANSGAFGGRSEISSLREALVRLGGENTWKVVALSAAFGLFDDVDGLGCRFRKHGVVAASIAQGLAARFKKEHIVDAYLATMMHDVGKLMLMQTKEFDYSKIPTEVIESDGVYRYEVEALGFDHGVLGAHILDVWNFPWRVCRVIALHHHPSAALKEGRDLAELVALVRLADQLEYWLHRDAWSEEELLTELERLESLDFLELSPKQALSTAIEAKARALEEPATAEPSALVARVMTEGALPGQSKRALPMMVAGGLIVVAALVYFLSF